MRLVLRLFGVPPLRFGVPLSLLVEDSDSHPRGCFLPQSTNHALSAPRLEKLYFWHMAKQETALRRIFLAVL